MASIRPAARSNTPSGRAREERLKMKPGIHPELKRVVIRCSCGAEWETLSTRENLRVDICSKCHPFFTGEERFVDTEGRVEQFRRRYQNQDQAKGQGKEKEKGKGKK
jgi:large subunit ribosomal protein L31